MAFLRIQKYYVLTVKCDAVDRVTAMYGIRKIGQIRQYLDQDSTVRLVHAFVTSRLDSCNSLIFGMSERDIAKIQRVQNIAARLVLRVPRHMHITPVLRELHWLPVRQRLAYKILLLAFKCLNGTGPKFIADLVELYIPSRALRSASKRCMKQSMQSTKSYVARAFSFAAAKLWNHLPVTLRQSPSLNIFKSKLKTYLFISQ